MISPKQEKTLALIKPDGVKRGLTGEVIRRIEQRGLKIVALELVEVTRDQINDHYPKDKEWITRLGSKTMSTYNKYGISAKEELGVEDEFEIGQMVREWILDFMTSGPIVKMVVQGIHAIDMVRKMAGHTLPNMAEMGTIRGDYSVDSPAAANSAKRSVHNIIHASETPEEAEHEIKFWFSPEEIHEYSRAEEDIMF
ncbi:MAG: nucleoside-diphosphate kinase [Patescibacteria group bacterium]|nr:nucleoside-diphosphate kinase [Patescibacteria group bacterium]